MQHSFWQNKWQEKQIGFNQTEPNELLVEYLSMLKLPKNSTLFVPLCGKSIDMIWLAEQGYIVVGCELVESAVQAFFTENNIDVNVQKHATIDNLTAYQGTHAGQSIKIWAGDIFDLTKEEVGSIDGVYDRAALVALPDDGEDSLRRRYVQKVIEITGTVPQLLLNFTVNEDVLDKTKGFDKETFGPPFVIEDDAIQDYYKEAYQVRFIAQAEPNGTDVLVNQAWLLTAKS